jgi:hypothetical protein
LHPNSRADGTERVVLVDLWDPERSHYCVADELLHRPAVRFE